MSTYTALSARTRRANISCARAFAIVAALAPAGGFTTLAAQSSLNGLASPIASIAFDSDDADLLPLMHSIGNSRIVVLGEATHSDGAASLAKARVARFLHERMGFEVLAWESGFLQTHAMNEALRNPEVPLQNATSYLMAGGWAWDQAIQPLFQYARQSWRTATPLVMAGFDTGRPHNAAPYFLGMLDELFRRAPWLRPSDADTAAIASMSRRGFGFLSSELTPVEVRDRERLALTRLRNRMNVARDSLLVVFSVEHVDLLAKAVEHLEVSEWLKESRGTERAYRRDREMAQMLRWLIEERYRGKKVIIWAATSHFTRNSDLISNPGDSSWYVLPYEAGNHLHAWFGDDLYTMAFTSYAGQLGDVHPDRSPHESRVRKLEPTGPAAVETSMHRLGHAFAFLDVAHAVSSGALPESFVSAALGRLENIAPWAKVIDAFFFVDQSEPIRYIR